MTKRQKAGAAAALVGGAYTFIVRPRMLRSGATDDEVRRPFRGAELIPDAERGATMAVTIDAPPSRVWPWLVQMGCDRAGWYSWDRLDNGGVPSSERIHPEWQRISVGDRLASTPSGSAWFEVAALDREHFLALRASLDLRGRPFDPTGQRPRFYTDSVWAFWLEELPPGRTRLMVGTFGLTRPRWLLAVGNALFWEPAHWLMQRRQFANLKRRAEREPREAAGDRAAASPLAGQPG